MTALSGHEPQIKISIPAAASRLLGALRRAGFEAYVVGGCVRDSLLGRTPGDWDICTSARPEQVRTVFSAYRQILTGEKHGTVAVIVGGTPYEITTYRVDGQYHDSRHPDAVQFVPQVQPDLARRDFTINAMAYAPGEGLIDLYGGRSDLHACLMRCVGDPEERFAEDALRILRAVRLVPSWILLWRKPPSAPRWTCGRASGIFPPSAFIPSWISCWSPPLRAKC